MRDKIVKKKKRELEEKDRREVCLRSNKILSDLSVVLFHASIQMAKV